MAGAEMMISKLWEKFRKPGLRAELWEKFHLFLEKYRLSPGDKRPIFADAYAQAKAGEALQGMAKEGARHRGHGDQKSGSRAVTPKLEDLGIGKMQSSRWQKAAAIEALA